MRSVLGAAPNRIIAKDNFRTRLGWNEGLEVGSNRFKNDHRNENSLGHAGRLSTTAAGDVRRGAERAQLLR